MRIEAEALGEEAAVCPAHVPAVHLYDAPMHLIAMRYLAPPFLILRRGLIAGEVYPRLAGRRGMGKGQRHGYGTAARGGLPQAGG